MAETIEVKNFNAGQVILREGDPGDCAYLLSSGAVQVFRTVDGQLIVLANIEEGSIFGEMALIDGSPRSANVRALRKTTCIKITGDVLDKAIAKADPIVRAMLLAYSRSMRSLLQRVGQSGALDSLTQRR
ncbi:MAG: cyclic nucleotide-binding domain-containing protein [Alphaproteobacteria bacterium]|nr:cyclic nucleotide-binding domain-containing protein [Alphaproteobacteria bacterium]